MDDRAASQSEERRGGRASLWLQVGGTLAIVVVVGVAIRLALDKRNEQQPVAPPMVVLSGDETRRLESLKSEAIALLENSRITEAEEVFARIAERLPNDELVLCNVAIGRVLRLQDDKTDDALDSAGEAIERLITNSPKLAIGYWLKSKWLADRKLAVPFEQQDTILAEQLEVLERGAALDEHAAFYPFEAHIALAGTSDAELLQRGARNVLVALSRDPENIFVLVDALQVLAQRRDSAFIATAERLEQILEPLQEGMLRRVPNVNTRAMLEMARELAAGGKWTEVSNAIRSIRPTIISEDVAQADKRRVLPHPLEFVIRKYRSVELALLPFLPPAGEPLKFRAGAVELEGLAEAHVVQLQWGDADIDGQTDLWVLSSGPDAQATRLTVFDRSPAGSSWPTFMSLDVPVAVDRMLLADLDRDDKRVVKRRPGSHLPPDAPVTKEADLDAVVFGPGGVRIVRNVSDQSTGVRTFQLVEQPSGMDNVSQVTAAALGDLDHDGDLDLILGADGSVQIWINQGNGVFDNVSNWSILPESGAPFTAMVAVDWDRDVDIDIVLAGSGGQRIGVLENLRHLQFRWHPLTDETGLDLSAIVGASTDRSAPQGLDVRVIEADGNASWDLVIARQGRTIAVLSDTQAAGSVKLRTAGVLGTPAASHLLTGDFDNDGYQDLLVHGSAAVQLLRGAEKGTFAATPKAWAEGPSGFRSADAADIDGDGDLDLALATDSGVVVVWNEEGPQRSWVSVEVRGIEEAISGRVNYLGIGSVIELRTASGHYQAQLVQSGTTHFGLGSDERAEVARVLFTNGIPQSIVAPDSRQLVRETQKQIGSCPYLYVWNGSEYEFYTDLLWAAPLGLITAEGQIMPDRPWEYLKLDGDRLAPRDGCYELQLTEELWEAGYFDQVELMAVDHPADVEVFSNEKVGPPELAKFQIHTVRNRRLPVAARNQSGRDLLPLLRARDNQYAECFDQTFRQGLAELHHLELDLGPLDQPRHITLFLTGWIRPTDTSLNLALWQDPRFEGPRPPRVLVPDSDGHWHEALAFMGFPGGKTKTIAVDLSGIFPANDYRLRIETSAEIRWDEVFFTVDEQPCEVQVTPLKLAAADLHYAGFSRRIEHAGGGPDTFEHQDKELTPQWPPMRGAFTRFGDVRELLAATDDRLAIIGAGDEITVRFIAPPPPPPGWRRDFILHNVGWDKDCVLNTSLGQTVEPLPFQAMPSYPYPASVLPDSPSLREYLRTYQTRTQPFAAFWKQLSGPRRGDN